MIHDFKKHIEINLGKSFKGKILATVSGGIDSVVLCYLLKASNVNFSIAHCNFKLRGDESDKDEEFVKNSAKKLSVPFYSKTFDTEIYAEEKGISIQMAARDLRYNWFKKLKKENSYDFIATAHHKNDNVETVLLNLVRGTGHQGLTGISYLKESIIRPLLPFEKEEIIKYAKNNNISWREDSSNQSDKYKRNLLRNKVIPLLEKLNPNFINTFSDNIEKFREENKVLSSQCSVLSTSVNIEEVKSAPSPLFQIWTWIEPCGFTFSDAKDIVESLNGESGKKFLSKTHQIIKDRNRLLLLKLEQKMEEEVIVDKIGKYKIGDCILYFSEVYTVDYSLGENVAFINSEKLKFPLKIRTWKEGDRFKPLGMKGTKLVSDFLIDEKVDIIEKEKQLVVEVRDGIVWLVGRRISEDFKVFDEASVIKIELKK